MICGARTRLGCPCQKPPVVGKVRCRLHGGLLLSVREHPNYQHGRCTKQARRDSVEITSRIRSLKLLAIQLGMIKPKGR